MNKSLNEHLLLISPILYPDQGEHRLEPGASGHPWGQLPHQPLLQDTRQCFWFRDHPRVPEDACPQEKPQLFPQGQLLPGVWAYHHCLYMCYLQAQLNRTDCSVTALWLLCPQTVIFITVLRQWYSPLSSDSDIHHCPQKVIFITVLRQWWISGIWVCSDRVWGKDGSILEIVNVIHCNDFLL